MNSTYTYMSAGGQHYFLSQLWVSVYQKLWKMLIISGQQQKQTADQKTTVSPGWQVVSDKYVWDDRSFQYNVPRVVPRCINISWQIYQRLQKISRGRSAYNCQLMNSLSTPTAALPQCVIHKSKLGLSSRHCTSFQVLPGGLNCFNSDTKLILEYHTQTAQRLWTW